MGWTEKNGRDLSYAAKLPEGAQALWAIQIATVDSLKWRGLDTISKFLGRNTVEHSFTRLAEIWCDKDGNPIIDPETGKLPPAIHVRGELNPGAIDPDDGHFEGLRIDPHTVGDIMPSFIPAPLIEWFDKAAFKKNRDDCPKCKIGILSNYCCSGSFDADHVVEQPVIVGDLETMEAMWATYQRRATTINEEGHDYHLTELNCHTINAALNKSNTVAVLEFANRGFMRWGANPDNIVIPQESAQVITSLDDLQRINLELSCRMQDSHQINKINAPQPQQIDLTPVLTVG